MSLLLLGIFLFFAIHVVSSTPLKPTLQKRFSEKTYKAGFALVSLVGLLLIIFGKANAPFEPIWNGLPQIRVLALPFMWLSFILLPAANMKGNVKRFTRHPMLWGIVFWSGVHLLLNGDLASILLFGSFFIYSLFAMVSQNLRGAEKQKHKAPLKNDIIVVVAGSSVFFAVLFLHGALFGVPLW